MIYQSNHRSPAMSSAKKTSPRLQGRNSQASPGKCAAAKAKRGTDRTGNGERCRGRCRVQWSEKHVKEGLVLVQETQLARVVKTGPISEHYEIDSKPVANGQWAKVYRCRSRSSGIVYAAKYSSRNRFNADCSAELRHEIALLSLCSQSPRVVRLHDVYETPKEIILVMEYAPGGDLQTLIDGDLVPLEGDVVHFVRQLAEGLAYLHERNIAHLDIKPQNLVMMGSFPDCDVKLCDFEISRVILEGTEVREILGTPDYVAPEILHYEPITLAADMWSLGVTTYVLLTGFSPFGGETDQETFQNISLGEVDFPEELFGDISAQAKDFVAKLLVLNPSARMTAKQCLRHDWLRGAPTQASPHLRRYLSKSREVLLERVVSRENLRRAALLSQASSQANLSSDLQESNRCDQSLQDCLLSQSEMCLSHRLTDSRFSLEGSEGFPSPADSRTSLNSSRTNLSCASQSCLLNKEQTQGLLSRAQSRSQANLDHGLGRGLLSGIRSLNRIQSQACLLNGNSSTTLTLLHPRMTANPVIGKSREKLYGVRSLSKSQGVLDICRSLECLKRKGKCYQRAKTEDALPIFKRLAVETTRTVDGATCCSDQSASNGIANDKTNGQSYEVVASEEYLDSLKSVESDTLTEDSDETPVNRDSESRLKTGKQPCQRQHSDASSRSNNSATSDDKEDRSTESENDEPKYTVAQLVSAFNKHQEVASRTSLESIMTEKRINEVTFPTGTKALRLFIPDIDISESKIVRRKTSYKPRKNWEELRKQNERNEGILTNLVDSSNEDEDEYSAGPGRCEKECDKQDPKNLFSAGPEVRDYVDTRIDEKYKRCVNDARINEAKMENEMQIPSILPDSTDSTTITDFAQQKQTNYTCPDVEYRDKDETQHSTKKHIASDVYVKTNTREQKADRTTPGYNADSANVNLKDILQKVDSFQSTPKENLENLRKRTSIAKSILNDNAPYDNSDKNGLPSNSESKDGEDKMKLVLSTSFVRSTSLSSDNECPTFASLRSEQNTTWEDVQYGTIGSSMSLEKEDPSKVRRRNEIQRTSSEGKGKQYLEDRRLWGRVCTGSYSRAMEKFSKNNDVNKKSVGQLNSGLQQNEKIRRKSSPAMPLYVNP